MNALRRLVLPLLLALGPTSWAASDLGRELAEQGDTRQGIPPCASCHASDGGGDDALGTPRLAGMDAGYLATQIENFKQGERDHPLMRPWAELLTAAETKAVTGYYASLPPISHASVPADMDPSAGAALARDGDWPGRRLPACVQCHGPAGIGVGAAFPSLAGQPYSYLLRQLTDWGKGERKGDPMGMMASISARLSAAESQAVAAYFAGLPAAEAAGIARRISIGESDPDRPRTATPGNAHEKTADIRAAPLAHQGKVQAVRAPDAGGSFAPPARTARPEGPLGEMAQLGESIFLHTKTHAVSGRHVGNAQACGNCHLDAGRLAGSTPMWAAWVAYPAYRDKDRRVASFAARIQDCFTYSMNARGSSTGHPPGAESETMIALLSYSYWLATNAPTGDKTMPGRGLPPLTEPLDGFDPARGATVYAAKCALCHGPEGDGGWSLGLAVFPPLWGPGAYNWGAGMHRVDIAAAFIKANMPLGGFMDLTHQEAWDVAAFINAHERPQDPRFTGDLADTTQRFHAGRFDYYGKRKGPDGRLLGRGTPSR